MKQVWVKFAAWSLTAATTRGEALPIVVTAIPEPRSMSRLPSTSSTMPPNARAAYTGMVVPTPRETAEFLRAISSEDRGPGMAVARCRLCSTVLTGDLPDVPLQKVQRPRRPPLGRA